MQETSIAPPILVVLDAAYGSRLRDVPLGRPTWVVMSSTNKPVVHDLWRTRPHRGSINGITGFTLDADKPFEDELIGVLDQVDLHHGPHSTPGAYIELEVVGTSLTADIRAFLTTLGFTSFDHGVEGFVVRRSLEAAKRQRD